MIELRFVVLNGFLSFSLLVKSIIKKPLELTRTRNVKTSGLHIIMLTTTSGLHSILPTTHTARREGPYHAFNPLTSALVVCGPS